MTSVQMDLQARKFRPVINLFGMTAEIPPPYPGEILRAITGSTVHGLSVANTDDLDLMGIRIEAVSEYLTLGAPFEQHEYRSAGGQNPSRAGDVDLVVYSLRKYLHLATKGNPSILNLLFVPEEHRHVDSPLAQQLRDLVPHILSRQAGYRYLGYMKAQRERLEGVRGQKRTGQTRRQYYTQAVGDPEPWDGKYGMHLIRLGFQGVELLETGHISLPMEEPTRSDVLAIRQGGYTKGSVLKWSMLLEQKLQRLIDESPLSARPNLPVVETWMRRAYMGRMFDSNMLGRIFGQAH